MQKPKLKIFSSLKALKKVKPKDLWAAVNGWLQSHKPCRQTNPEVQIDDNGLLSGEPGASEPAGGTGEQVGETDKVVVKAVTPADKEGSIEKMQEGFNKLLEQLQGINAHLNEQIGQHRELMSRIEQLPGLLESFPAVVESQKQIIEELLGQLRAGSTKQQQFVDAVERIPDEIAKQGNSLVDIDHQLAAAADTDVQMAESFNKFNETLEKLNDSTVGQTDSITQMSKTFATSDRYLKYIISKQNRRFVWVFIAAVGVCVAVILIFTGIIIYLRR